MQRVVHFDLKGAPPKLTYFEQVLRCIKSWGVTGVLLEWEDTFPYSGNLTHLGSKNNSGGDEMYSIHDVHHILSICKEIGLEVIQLVQTIGHMEFVLKHQCHEHLREYEPSPAIICPEKLESKELVREMVMQALAVQPDAKYFHIGADEVCHIAYCETCRKRIKSAYPIIDHWRIYLDYIRDLALFIREQRPNITILMWDDMIRAMTPEVLEEYRELSEMIQLVVWNYEVRDNFRFPPAMWVMYNIYFPTVWAGSAFKGANGSSQLISPVSRYVNNQIAWINEIRVVSSVVQFAGIMFTGWSRYDHFATLCELLPTSMNSLANCLKCFEVGTLENYAELHRDNTLADGQWAGRALAECARGLARVRAGCLRVLSGDLRTTWLNSWQLSHGFLNMFQVDNIENFVLKLLVELKNQEKIARQELPLMFGPRTCSEWIQTYLDTMEAGLMGVQHTIKYARRYDPRSPEYAFGRPSLNAEHVSSIIGQNPSTSEHLASATATMNERVNMTDEHMPSTSEHAFSAVISKDEASATASKDERANMTDEHMPSTSEHVFLDIISKDENALMKDEDVPSTIEDLSSKVDDVP